MGVKSPTGKGRTTISNQFRRASQQSSHVVFDSRRVRLEEDEVLRQVRRELQTRKAVRVVLFITKAGQVTRCLVSNCPRNWFGASHCFCP
ncbi:MAG: hypothetical protein LBV00_03145 [Propionibacteriaceae bacterium]|nr:hypothetical protein [Propionibacteriaceae bacterium]